MSEKPKDISSLDRFKDVNPQDINWFPGHMYKAEKQLQQKLKRVDAVLELRDARIPFASANLEFEKLLGEKKRLVLFNKTSLSDEEATQGWTRYFQVQGIAFLFIDVLEKRGLRKILPEIRRMMQSRQERFQRKGIRPPALRLMVIGIPNVGKSSLINGITHRKATETGQTREVPSIRDGTYLTGEVNWPNPRGSFSLRSLTLRQDCN